MDTLISMRVFRQVVESGSFVAASECMQLSTASVSKHVMHIERRLGTRLLNRNSRAVSLTESGGRYYECCKSVLDDLEATELELASLGRSPRGTVRVMCPSWFYGRLLAQLLVEFRRRYPEIVIDVAADDGNADLVEEGYDVALRVPTDDTSLAGDLIARPIKSITLCVLASRQYLETYGRPESPADLARHDCVASGNMTSWAFRGPEGTTEVPTRVVARYRSAAGVASAVAAGLGLAALPAMFLEDPEFKDALVPVLAEFPMRQATMYAVHVSRKYVPPKVRAFLDFAFEWGTGVTRTNPQHAADILSLKRKSMPVKQREASRPPTPSSQCLSAQVSG